MSLPEAIAAMQRPEFYPHRPAAVVLVQTHISYVLLAGEHVYKVKKSVRFSFLDFSTLARRRSDCHEEVRLNRRLAAGVYHGVLAICRDGTGGFRLGVEDDAEAVEYAVHMRRLPEARMLNRLLEAGSVTAEMMRAVAERLADFHRTAETNAAITAAGDPAAILRVLEDNYANTKPFRDRILPAADDDAIQAFARRFLRDHESLLHTRQAAQRIRDGHGDLHTEHICFTDGLVIFDCIEFNPRFRHIDVASEIAFLAMDLDYHERPDLADHFVDCYVAAAGDPDVRRLAPFYKCARAYVRGQVNSMKSVEEEVAAADREEARSAARRHFALAYRYTWAYTPCIAAVAGLSGTGKSTIAAALQRRTGFAHISSDQTRKALPGVAAAAAPARGYATGLYAPEISARTYAAMLAAAAERLAAGSGVILDGTYQRRSDRDALRHLAARYDVPVLFVDCRCAEAVVRQRLDQRARSSQSLSDADWEVYKEQQRRFEPFAVDEEGQRLAIDTEASVEDTVRVIEDGLRSQLQVASGKRLARISTEK